MSKKLWAIYSEQFRKIAFVQAIQKLNNFSVYLIRARSYVNDVIIQIVILCFPGN